MSGFGAWAAGAGGTGVLLLCLFTLGLILGYLTGWRGRERAARADAREDRAEREAAEFVEELRPPEPERHWEPVHVGQALALTRPGQAAAAFDVDAEIAAIHAAADEIVLWAREAGGQWTTP